MKAIALILAVVLICTKASEDQNVLQQWHKFQADFGRSYRSPLEARNRFSIFQDNLKAIEAHNILFEKGLSSFKMGVNRFSDWTEGEYSDYANGTVFSQSHLRGNRNFFVRSLNADLPESVDWRDKGVVSEVRNQGTCESCWAFSAAGAIEAEYKKKSGKLVPLSPQYLVDCSRNGVNRGCNRGNMNYAYLYVYEHGIDSDKDYPYEARDGVCRADKHEIVTKISEFFIIPQGDEKTLTEAIATHGPVSVAVDASTDFGRYSSGIFDGECRNKEITHAVLAVGYGTENGKDFYIIKNSWGADWGENGYVRLARNKDNKCGITVMASFPVI